MKIFTIIIFCLTLNIAVVWAEDFHLVQTQVRDASGPGVPVESLTVYVLVLPDHEMNKPRSIFNGEIVATSIGTNTTRLEVRVPSPKDADERARVKKH